jgi:hypothetical protein
VLGSWAVGGLALGLLGERYGPHVRGGYQTSPSRQSHTSGPAGSSRTATGST